MNTQDETIRVCIGTDRSQRIAVEVLKYSIKKNTQANVEFIVMEDLDLPEPSDIRQGQRTGFSFARWHIPELCQYKGKAIYLDADMLVFTDILGLWSLSDEKFVINIVDGTDSSYCASNTGLNKNETSVMILNCSKADWDIKSLVDALDNGKTYYEFTRDLYFIDPRQISRNVPRKWNSMDYWDSSVALLHYTNISTQPWVSVHNKYGYVWTEELKSMIKDKVMSREYVEQEVKLGYVRPSIMHELENEVCKDIYSEYASFLDKIDRKHNYIPHRALQIAYKHREDKIRKYELNLARKQSLALYVKHLVHNFIVDAKRFISSSTTDLISKI